MGGTVKSDRTFHQPGGKENPHPLKQQIRGEQIRSALCPQISLCSSKPQIGNGGGGNGAMIDLPPTVISVLVSPWMDPGSGYLKVTRLGIQTPRAWRPPPS